MCEVCSNEGACVAIGERVVDHPRLLVRALESGATIASSASGNVSGLVVGRTRKYRPVEVCLAVPPARRFTAVPKPGCDGFARVVELRALRKNREQSDRESNLA